jgi:hypothetical protein
MTPEEALRRSREAERLMQDPMLKEAMDIMEREVMEAWMSCPIRDLEGREAAWRMAVTTRKFRELLKGTAESGKLAAEQIRQKELSLLDRAKNKVANWR